uniref:CHK domain-containing protein n=1 Tax=Glossina brevipalpis TaxID=37001 RepID=A0A1A9WZ80_9MUSC
MYISARMYTYERKQSIELLYLQPNDHNGGVNEIEINDLKIKKINLGGDNYCSDIYQSHVVYRLNTKNLNGNDEGNQRFEEIQLIIKSMPKEKQGVLQRLQIFNREKFFYTQLKIQMETLMALLKNSWLIAPKLYHYTTEPFETLIFEDLKQLSFQLSSRQDGLNKTESLLVMEKLAEYHACSMLILSNSNDVNDIRNRYSCGILNDISIKSESFKLLFGGQLLKLSQLLADDLEFSQSSKKLLNYYDKFTKNVLSSVYPLEGHINVLNHGDVWVNNLFFKYDKRIKDGKPIPTDIRFFSSKLSKRTFTASSSALI